MVNEEISEKTVRIFVRVTELSAREIEKYLSKYLSEQKQKRANKAVEKKTTGKQTIASGIDVGVETNCEAVDWTKSGCFQSSCGRNRA